MGARAGTAGNSIVGAEAVRGRENADSRVHGAPEHVPPRKRASESERHAAQQHGPRRQRRLRQLVDDAPAKRQ